jgi:hypothetical protein
VNRFNDLFYLTAFLIASINVGIGNGLHKNATQPAAKAWRSVNASAFPESVRCQLMRKFHTRNVAKLNIHEKADRSACQRK